MNLARSLWRLGASVAHVFYGAWLCLTVFPFLSEARRLQRVGRWCHTTLALLGIELASTGAPHPAPVLFVANHVSWLDILAINAVCPARFVSKADVRRWPLLGWMVACGGTLFIERERKRDALRVVHHVAEVLRGGAVVAVFPEGTTSPGHALLPFHANLLQAAIATATPVQPIALRFSDSSASVSAAAAYVGDMSLAASLWAVVGARGLAVRVTMLPARSVEQADRRGLGDRLRGDIGEALGVSRPGS